MKWDKEQALISVDGDYELLEDIFLLFVDTYNADMARIEIAYKMKNWKVLSEAAHSIKGAALVMGFEDVTICARKIEHEVKEGLYDNLVQYYNELQGFSQELSEFQLSS